MTSLSHQRILNGLTILAAAVALTVIPILGIEQPLVHVLTLAFGLAYWQVEARIASSWMTAATEIGLGWSSSIVAWSVVVVCGLGSAAMKWWLDASFLHGLGGLAFYEHVLRETGLRSVDGSVAWPLLVLYGPALFLVILVDGIFYAGIIQKQLARRVNHHTSIQVQAALFALPHLFAGELIDPLYGASTYLGGLAYGYMFAAVRNHWMPAAMLWLHVLSLWIALLLATPI